ncbi:hypothetical protein K7G98_22205, partial [Saccharothrix sp. MB29]|nr:hypothetical protein [Saccharothrix sp. MB29]
RLTGPLDRRALHAALVDVVTRHEALRTVFAEHDGEPHQVVLDSGPGLVEARVDAADLDAALAREARTAFHPDREPPLKVTLFQVGDEEHVVALVLHHLAGDGWSVGPLVRDLATAYAARRAGGAAPDWRLLPVQYADYTVWRGRCCRPGPARSYGAGTTAAAAPARAGRDPGAAGRRSGVRSRRLRGRRPAAPGSGRRTTGGGTVPRPGPTGPGRSSGWPAANGRPGRRSRRRRRPRAGRGRRRRARRGRLRGRCAVRGPRCRVRATAGRLGRPCRAGSGALGRGP